jgi:hypothetical protein
MLICVTQEHIQRGEEGSITGCPIALALNEATGMGWGVGSTQAHLLNGQTIVNHVNLPLTATDFIFRFDNALVETLKPFEFEFPWEKPEAVVSYWERPVASDARAEVKAGEPVEAEADLVCV